jgi:hypothetical protein
MEFMMTENVFSSFGHKTIHPHLKIMNNNEHDNKTFTPFLS